jgi:hypothetical protein
MGLPMLMHPLLEMFLQALVGSPSETNTQKSTSATPQYAPHITPIQLADASGGMRVEKITKAATNAYRTLRISPPSLRIAACWATHPAAVKACCWRW